MDPAEGLAHGFGSQTQSQYQNQKQWLAYFEFVFETKIKPDSVKLGTALSGILSSLVEEKYYPWDALMFASGSMLTQTPPPVPNVRDVSSASTSSSLVSKGEDSKSMSARRPVIGPVKIDNDSIPIPIPSSAILASSGLTSAERNIINSAINQLDKASRNKFEGVPGDSENISDLNHFELDLIEMINVMSLTPVYASAYAAFKALDRGLYSLFGENPTIQIMNRVLIQQLAIVARKRKFSESMRLAPIKAAEQSGHSISNMGQTSNSSSVFDNTDKSEKMHMTANTDSLISTLGGWTPLSPKNDPVQSTPLTEGDDTIRNPNPRRMLFGSPITAERSHLTPTETEGTIENPIIIRNSDNSGQEDEADVVDRKIKFEMKSEQKWNSESKFNDIVAVDIHQSSSIAENAVTTKLRKNEPKDGNWLEKDKDPVLWSHDMAPRATPNKYDVDSSFIDDSKNLKQFADEPVEILRTGTKRNKSKSKAFNFMRKNKEEKDDRQSKRKSRKAYIADQEESNSSTLDDMSSADDTEHETSSSDEQFTIKKSKPRVISSDSD